VYFVGLDLQGGDGKKITANFYWISAKKTVYDWKKTTYQFTPASSYEDFTALQSLPKVGALDVSAFIEPGGEGPMVRVKLRNPSDQLAFQVALAVERSNNDEEILPVLWQDNYIELLPGESREITAQFVDSGALRDGAKLRVAGWNIQNAIVPIQQPASDGSQGENQ
jgi:exo-1,4-beta-D-glucosaminidase